MTSHKTTTTCTCTALLLLLLLLGNVRAEPTSCISKLQQILDEESRVSDVSSPRFYVLCPNTTFVTEEKGTVVTTTTNTTNATWGAAEERQVPLVLRPNMHVRCGNSGSRSNACIITGGALGIFGAATLDGHTDLGHVVLQGLTVQSVLQNSLVIGGQHGRVEIVDCAFQVSSCVRRLLQSSCS